LDACIVNLFKAQMNKCFSTEQLVVGQKISLVYYENAWDFGIYDWLGRQSEGNGSRS
jgi:hypothetical protein